MIVIGHDIDYSYLGLGISHSQPFFERYFVIVLYVFYYFLSFIDNGLAMCRLRGVIMPKKCYFEPYF